MVAKKPFMPTTWTTPNDAPEFAEALFQTADRYDGTTLKPRSRLEAATPKKAVKLRLEANMLASLRGSDDGWQTRINDALRASLALAGKMA